MSDIRFKFAPQKAKAALHLAVSEQANIDLHSILKACYFADKSQLNQNHRPIFGASYRAMKFGPVPLEIYEMAKGEPMWLAEMGLVRFPWELRGFRLALLENEEPDLSPLSDSDEAHFREGLARSVGLNFNERTEATHGPDWQKAELGMMRYEDMIDDSPDKEAIVERLAATSRFMRL